mmetsp:Transcript_24119/g.63655  ORF Transcript_24119/g.63655 Transcript_24119/m.63655 type:complete len:220 (-) Transcript_24119:141-800(-)
MPSDEASASVGFDCTSPPCSDSMKASVHTSASPTTTNSSIELSLSSTPTSCELSFCATAVSRADAGAVESGMSSAAPPAACGPTASSARSWPPHLRTSHREAPGVVRAAPRGPRWWPRCPLVRLPATAGQASRPPVATGKETNDRLRSKTGPTSKPQARIHFLKEPSFRFCGLKGVSSAPRTTSLNCTAYLEERLLTSIGPRARVPMISATRAASPVTP